MFMNKVVALIFKSCNFFIIVPYCGNICSTVLVALVLDIQVKIMLKSLIKRLSGLLFLDQEEVYISLVLPD